MILIQLLLVVAFLVFLFKVLANPTSYQIKAWAKIFATLFVGAAVLTVIFPDTTNAVAHFLGVTRGADLLLYTLTMAFIYTIFNTYVQEKRLQQRIVMLARKLALLEANERQNRKPHSKL